MLTDKQLLAKYGMTKAQLLSAAKRERDAGNSLAAGCLHDAAYGYTYEKHKSRLDRLIKSVKKVLKGIRND